MLILNNSRGVDLSDLYGGTWGEETDNACFFITYHSQLGDGSPHAAGIYAAVRGVRLG